MRNGFDRDCIAVRGLWMILFIMILPGILVVPTAATAVSVVPEEEDDLTTTIPALHQEDFVVNRRLLFLGDEGDDDDDGYFEDEASSSQCKDHLTCDECAASIWCHWCKHDEACHARGSFSGCVMGETCPTNSTEGPTAWPSTSPSPSQSPTVRPTTSPTTATPSAVRPTPTTSSPSTPPTIVPTTSHPSLLPTPARPTPQPTVDTSCAGQTSCQACTAFHLCHWCAHDNACHVVGSVYGCVSGINCYSNDRCQRKEPEPLTKDDAFARLNPLPLAIVVAVGALLACCATLCFGCAAGVKGAYEELPVWHQTGGAGEEEHEDAAREPLLPQEDFFDAQEETNNNTSANAPATATTRTESTTATEESTTTSSGEATADATAAETTTPLQPNEQGDESEEADPAATATTTETETPSAVPQSPRRNHRPRRNRRYRPRHIQRLYNVCAVCYCLTIVAIGVSVFGAIRYYPRIPEYNICNDSVAWKSLMESMTSMKVGADFEILASVANPNALEVALDKGSGSFLHDGTLVGTYDIPPVTAAGNAITDILLVAHFTPEKWQALSIAAEYSQGKLVMSVTSQVTLRLPFLLNYSFDASLDHIVVHVNQLSSRKYCACQSWNSTSTAVVAPPLLAGGESESSETSLFSSAAATGHLRWALPDRAVW